MKNNKSLKNEGLFSMADRFVADFFDHLKRGATDHMIKKAEKAKLPPPVVQKLIDIDREVKELEKSLKKYEK